MNKKLILVTFLAGLITNFVCAESQGEKLFSENKPSEAIIMLESEIQSGNYSTKAHNFLGLAYYQTGDFEKSVKAFGDGLKVPGTNKKVLAFNQGNSYYAMNNFTEAAKSYSLAYTADANFTKALLNRANAYLMGKEFESALKDYEKYIIVCPDDPQRDEIVAVIAALKREIQRLEEEARLAAEEEERMRLEAERLEQEMARLREEEAKRAEEERLRKEAEEAELRRQEEQRRAEEAERRRKLLEDVANSLQQTDTTNMSAGTEDLFDYDQEGELD